MICAHNPRIKVGTGLNCHLNYDFYALALLLLEHCSFSYLKDMLKKYKLRIENNKIKIYTNFVTLTQSLCKKAQKMWKFWMLRIASLPLYGYVLQ